MRSDAVAEAARTTLCATTARADEVQFAVPPPSNPLIGPVHRQTTIELQRRRTRILEPEGGLRADDDERPARPSPTERITTPTRRFDRVDGRWIARDRDVARSWREDPFTLLSALLTARTITVGAVEDVRGTPARRHHLAVALGPDPRPIPFLPPVRLAGEAWIDADGLLRRVSVTALGSLRPRALLRDRPQRRTWHALELWDFGGPETIEVPEVETARAVR